MKAKESKFAAVRLEKSKLMAAIAVLAVMFAAFAVVLISDDSYATNETKTSKDGYVSVSETDALKVSVDGNKFVFTGSAEAGKIGTTSFTAGDFGTTAPFTLFAGIQFTMELDNLKDKNVQVTQKNSALSLYPNDDKIAPNSDPAKDSWVKISDANRESDNTYAFLIPKDTSTVEITLKTKATGSTEYNQTLGTYVFDFSKVSTKIVLDNTELTGTGWMYTNSGTLAFDNYNGKEIFYGMTEVNLKGINTINAYGNADLGHGEGSYVIKAKDNSALNVKATDGEASLTINQHADAFTIYSHGALTVGDNTNSAKRTILTINGGDRGLYSGTSIALNNSDVTISVSEYGIRTISNASPGTLAMVNSTAKVDLQTENEYVNGEGGDDRFGVKVTALETIDKESVLTTDGLRLKTALTQAIAGKIIIDGYEQNPSAEMAPLIAGFYSDAPITAVSAYRTANTTDVGKIYLIGDAEAYNIEVKSGDKTAEKTSGTAEDVINALADADIKNVTFTGVSGDFTVPEGKTLTLVASSAYTGTISTGSSAAKQSVQFNQFVGSVKIVKGSVEISQGTIDSGSITLDGAAVVIDGVAIPASKTFAIDGTGTVTIKAGKIMTVAGILTVGPEVTVEVYGKLLKNGDSAAITNNGTIRQMEGGEIGEFTFANNNPSYTEADMKELEVSGETEKDLPFSEKQLVTVLPKGLAITKTVSVAGKLVVPAGAKLTIQAGGELILKNSAELVVEGTLEIEEKSEIADAGKLTVIKGTVTVSGTLTNNGIMAIGTAGNESAYAAYSTGVLTVAQDGSVVVGENGSIETYTNDTVVRGKVVVEQSGTLEVAGLVYGEIYNAGTVSVNSFAPAAEATTVNQIADGAAVKIENYTVLAGAINGLTVTDAGMVLATYRESGMTVEVSVTGSDSVSILPAVNLTPAADWKATVSGVTVVSSVGTKATKTSFENSQANAAVGKYNDKQYSKTMDVSGTPTVSYRAVNTATVASGTTVSNTATIGFFQTGDNAKIAVTGELVLGDYVTLTVDGKIAVTGSVSAGKDADLTNSGEITVSKNGEVATVQKTVADTINAALYETSEKVSGSTVKTYHYVSLDAAIAKMNEDANVKNVVLKGDQSVTADAKIPAGATLDLSGKKATIDKEKTLTVASGATVKNGSVDVDGTLFAEKKTDLKNLAVTADVKSEETAEDGTAKKDGWIKYTNLSDALVGAKPGETISVNDAVTIEADTVVPEGVTLVIGADYTLTLNDGVRFTVDGILKADGKIQAQSAFALVPMNLDAVAPNADQYSSTILVNGKLMSATKLVYAYGEPASTSGSVKLLTEGAPVAGAYYEQGAYYVVSSVAIAEKEIANITSGITINGAVTAGDISFAGTDDCTEIVIGAGVNNGQTGASEKAIDTVFTVGSLTVAGMKVTFAGAAGYFTGDIVVGEAAVSAQHANGFTVVIKDSKMYLGGAVYITDKGDSLAIAKGTVYTGEALNVTSNTYSTTKAWYNYVTVEVGATLAVDVAATVDYISVDGTLSVPSTKSFTVDVRMDVTGTVDVAASTGTAAAGTLSVKDLYIGVSDKDLTGAAAAFSGPVSILANGKVLVSNDAAVNDAFIDSVKDLKKTAFNVNGSVWFVAYANGTATVTVNKIPVQNVELLGWAKTDGGERVGTTNTFNIGDNANLYALINTAIYKIVIKADEGIANVYLNGQALYYGAVSEGKDFYYAYTATVAAGDYKVTYTLKNGWSGDAKLSGDNVSGMTLSVSGDAGNKVFQLTGIEKSGYVEPSEPVEEKDDGMTITDYLLIILVVLIVVLAIIVAMRLMRS